MSEKSRKKNDESRVHWYEWGDSVFELAAQRDLPILLYISATWGSAVHQFDTTVLANEAVRAIINSEYIPVKVDGLREPDVVERYNQGAWPALCMLTSSGELLHGRTGLSLQESQSSLQQVAEYYKQNREEIHKQIEESGPPRLPRAESDGDFSSAAATLDAIRHEALAYFDTKYDGWGRSPKFPLPELHHFLLEDPEHDLRRLSMVTLETMRKSPLRDPLGGGFHRYCTDESWRNPVFDKQLSDNAGLLAAYAEAYRQTGDTWIRETAEGVVRDIESAFGDPTGLFYSVVDSEGLPGDPASYYGWAEEDIKAAVDDDGALAVLLTHFGLSRESLVSGSNNRYVLEERFAVSQVAIQLGMTQDQVREKLTEGINAMKRVRAERIAPGVDAEFYIGHQGQAMGPLAQASLLLDRPRLLQRAFEIADLLWEKGRSTYGGMRHLLNDEEEETIFLADQVDVIDGYLELYRISGRAKDLQRAVTLLEETLDVLGDDEGPACFSHLARAVEHGALRWPYTPFEENAKLLYVMSIIAALTQDNTWHDRAMNLVGGLEVMRPAYKLRDSYYGRALRRLVGPPPMVDLLTGDGVGEMRREMLNACPPGTLFRAFDPDQTTPWTPLERYPSNGNQARAVVHVGGVTFEPTHDVEVALLHLNEEI